MVLMAPPLIITASQVDDILEILDASLAEIEDNLGVE
jgi:adenosylmethionine-8-amino-7-oxononanoate aminotransferase